MSNILDVITNAVKDKPVVKPVTSTKGKALESVTANVLSVELEALVQKDFKVSKLVVKAEGAEYAAFKELVLECEKAGVFSDSKLLKLVQTRIAVVFNSETISARRNTMLNNTSKVAYGGTVGRESDGSKRTVSGKGWAAVLEVLTTATSIRTYHPLITAAKPEGLKAKPKSDVEIAAAKEALNRKEEAKAIKEAAKRSKVITHDDAFVIALESLAMVEKFLLPGTHAKQIEQLHSLTKFFKSDMEELKVEKAA